MKKVFAALVLAMLVAGGVFAQENWGGKKNFASADLGLIVGGARYERLLTPKISVGADFYWANSFIIFNELDAGVFGRYYIWKGFFAELGLGFHTHTGNGEFEYEYTWWDGSKDTYKTEGVITTTGFGISPGLGWKFDPGKAGGFFVEPGISVPITIGAQIGDPIIGLVSDYDLGAGVSVGFILHVGLGWAF
jgi:hypothetical protein